MSDPPYAVWHPFSLMPYRADDLTAAAMDGQQVVAVQGRGAWVRDRDGRSYLNCFNAANVIGLGREEVADRVAEQLRRLSFQPLFAGGHPLAEDLALRLLQIAPPQFRMAFFSNDGSGAVETALKMARQYFVMIGEGQRRAFLGLSGAYHGSGYGALSLTDQGLHPLFEPMVPDCHTVPAPNVYRPPFPGTPAELARACADALEQQILALGPETVAAVIVEPVQGLGGIVPFPPEYFPLVREVTRRHGVLLIADEVTTGFGRLGAWFGGSRYAIDADIMAGAKGITSGYFPLGVTLATAQIYDAFAGGAFPHGWTCGGHPAGCAAGLAVLDVIAREDLVARAAATGDQLLAALRAALGNHPNVGDVRGVGMMIGVELVADRATKARLPAPEARLVVRALREAGLLVAYVEGVISLYPPLSITPAEADAIVERLIRGLEALRPEHAAAAG